MIELKKSLKEIMILIVLKLNLRKVHLKDQMLKLGEIQICWLYLNDVILKIQ